MYNDFFVREDTKLNEELNHRLNIIVTYNLNI